ncbi:hypothetical protein, partial [Anaerosporobacter sp.]|uniref:hypothetical protein n=1 Tax=Anaerosporobacter sp. TaxID=1872529 RepID=UPI00286F9BF3
MADDKKLVEKKPVAKKKVAVTNKLSKEEQLEQLYQKTIAVFNSMSCMTVTKSKLDMYNHLKNEFGSLKDYKDSEEYVKKCKENYEETEKMLIQKEYDYCCRHLELAKTEKDYSELSQAFKTLLDYKDSEELAQRCDKILKSKANKMKYAVIRKSGVVLALLVLVLFACTKPGRYNVARVFNKLTFYQRSA